MFYKNVIRPILFKLEPEFVHNIAIKFLKLVSEIKPVFFLIKKYCLVDSKILESEIGNLKFSNPVGLAAGFDKNITAPLAYSMLGFGFAELGSITYESQSGNPRPRLWRIPKDKGLIVYYGLSNCGVKKALQKIKKIKKRFIPYGVSIAPTTRVGESGMLGDYLKSFSEVYELADYVTLNVSCPNVVACSIFIQIDFIKNLLKAINESRKDKKEFKDIFIKISPDMDYEYLDKIVDLCLEYSITGIVATNLIKNRSNLSGSESEKEKLEHPGGVSGKLLQNKSTQIISRIYNRSEGKLKIIGVGGIFTGQDAYDKIKAGASALQMITGFIYEGPLAVRRINLEVLDLMKKDGFKSLKEVVGINHKSFV